MPEARLLAVLASLATLCLILRLIWRLHGLVPALVTKMLPAVLLNWLIMRRERRNHWVLLAGVGVVIAVCLAVMIPLFDPGRQPGLSSSG